MLSRWTRVVALAVLGCGSAPPPPPKPVVRRIEAVPVPVAKPTERPACVIPSDEVTAISQAGADGMTVQFCIGAEGTECFGLDVQTGKVARLKERPKDTRADSARVEMTNPELKVCADTCKTMTAKVIPNAAKLRGATNADATFAVFLLGDAPRGKGYAEIWNVPLAKREASFKYAQGDFRCGDVAVLGQTIYVSASTCRQPAARGTLYTRKGKKLANVGSKDFGVFGDAYVQVEGSSWAFLEENASALVIQDIVTGKVTRRIDLRELFKHAGTVMGNPGEHEVVRLADGSLAVVAGAPVTGSVARIDLKTGDLSIIRTPVCSAE